MQLHRRHIALVVGIIAVGSLVPLPATGGTSTIPLTAAGHLIGYAVLAYVITAVYGSTVRTGMWAIILASGFGAGIELLQIFVPTREFAWGDIILNVVAATSGAIGAVGIRRKLSREGNLGDRSISEDDE